MADMGSIAAAIGSLKTAADIAKGFLDLKEAAAVQGRVIELQGIILAAQSSALAAQSEQFTLLEEIRGLKEKMTQMEAWEAEKKRYKLAELAPGVTALELKEEMSDGEPPHHICGSCYQHAHKSVLQREDWAINRAEVLVCHDCGSVLYVSGLPHPSHKSLKPEPYRGP